MLKVEKKQHKQTSIVRFTEFFQICLLFGTIHRSNLALFMLTKIISSLFCIEFSLALILLILIELSSVSFIVLIETVCQFCCKGGILYSVLAVHVV